MMMIMLARREECKGMGGLPDVGGGGDGGEWFFDGGERWSSAVVQSVSNPEILFEGVFCC